MELGWPGACVGLQGQRRLQVVVDKEKYYEDLLHQLRLAENHTSVITPDRMWLHAIDGARRNAGQLQGPLKAVASDGITRMTLEYYRNEVVLPARGISDFFGPGMGLSSEHRITLADLRGNVDTETLRSLTGEANLSLSQATV